jgi:hypothetical protein
MAYGLCGLLVCLFKWGGFALASVRFLCAMCGFCFVPLVFWQMGNCALWYLNLANGFGVARPLAHGKRQMANCQHHT